MSIEADCQERRTDSNIKLSERGRKAIFLNPHRHELILTTVDGCVMKNELAADFVVEKQNVGAVVVELKGRNVEHAVKQIMATALLWRDRGLITAKFGSLIVCSQFPSVSTSVQKAQADFSKRFKGPLRVVCHKAELSIEAALAFK